MPKALLLSALLLLGFTATAQVVYVDIDATGANNGTTWADAYTDLAMALDSAAAGSSLWIAAGTYVTPETTSFFIERELALYGGFAGTETELSAADPAANVTVLSGDVLGNDPDAYDADLMSDNNRVLVVLDTNETNTFTAMVQGLTIHGGVLTGEFETGSIVPFSGGGVLALGRVHISDVIFTGNRANFGSATAFVSLSATGSSATNVTLEGNYFSLGGLLFSNGGDSLRYADISYTGTSDTMPSPVINAFFSRGLDIRDCSFANVITGNRAFGGTISTSNVVDLSIVNCTFDNVFADVAGGAIGISHFEENEATRNNLPLETVIDSCVFTEARAGGAGGGLFLQNANVTVRNSEFTQNASANGGAIYAQSTNEDQLEYVQAFVNNTFTANSSVDGGGGILAITDQTAYEVTGNTFILNSSTQAFGGGAIYLQGDSGSDPLATLTGNDFSRNNAIDQLGGAVRLTSIDGELRDNTFRDNNGSTGTVFVSGENREFTFVNNTFAGNTGTTTNPIARGGGIASFLTSGEGANTITIDSCTFTQNTVGQDDFISGGGAIYLSGEAPGNATINIRNSLFAGNGTEGGVEGSSGGAIVALNGMELNIEDCDFIGNSSESSGGAITTRYVATIDSSGSTVDTILVEGDQPVLNIDRSFFFTNTASAQGGAIDLLSSSINMKNSLVVQNALDAGVGSGGAIIINGTTVDDLVLQNFLINNTFYANRDGGAVGSNTQLKSAGNAVAIFQDGGTSADANAVVLTIQNNAFFQGGEQEEAIGIELTGNDGSVQVRSLGGNFFNSELSPDFTIEQVSGADIVDTEVDDLDVFTDPELDNINAEFPSFELAGDAATNPLVDAGTTGELVPEVDLYGMERDDMPDIGALEFGSIDPTGVAEPIEDSGLAIDFFPNPAINSLNIVNTEAGVQAFSVLLSDASGRLISAQRFAGERNALPVADLPTGVYNLTLYVNDKVYSKQFLKR